MLNTILHHFCFSRYFSNLIFFHLMQYAILFISFDCMKVLSQCYGKIFTYYALNPQKQSYQVKVLADLWCSSEIFFLRFFSHFGQNWLFFSHRVKKAFIFCWTECTEWNWFFVIKINDSVMSLCCNYSFAKQLLFI